MRGEFQKKYMMKVLLNFFKKYQVPFTWNYFATSDGKGAIDGIGGEAKSIVRQQDLSKMKNVIAQNASDFAEVCKANLHRVTTHLITKQQLQKVENLDLWSVSPDVKSISKARVAVINTDGVLRIWYNDLDMIYPPNL